MKHNKGFKLSRKFRCIELKQQNFKGFASLLLLVTTNTKDNEFEQNGLPVSIRCGSNGSGRNAS